jgi:hypothetical protein
MIPTFDPRTFLILWAGPAILWGSSAHAFTEATASAAPAVAPSAGGLPAACLTSGDGYLRATVAGAIDAKLDWPNSGTRCEGESRPGPGGVRLSFQRASGGAPNLLLVFGVSGVKEGQGAHQVGVNLTIIVQGTPQIFGTLGDARCTVDTLTQRKLPEAGAYRVEARGFCTQPAHAIRGNGDVLVSTFEFAGPVSYGDAGRPEEAGRRDGASATLQGTNHD